MKPLFVHCLRTLTLTLTLALALTLGRAHPLGDGLVACAGTRCPDGLECYATPDGTRSACVAVTGAVAGAEAGVGVGAGGGGVTFDKCVSEDDCAGGRRCRSVGEIDVTECEGRAGCVCLTPEPVRCANSAECDDGEVCRDTPAFGRICLSRNAVENGDVDVSDTSDDDDAGAIDEDEDTDDEGNDDDAATPRESPAAGNRTALVLEPCATTADCLPPRECLDIADEPDARCPPAGARCVCGYLVIPACADDADCAEGEACIPRSGMDHDFCVSKNVLSSGGGGVAPMPSAGVDGGESESESEGEGAGVTAEPSADASPDASPATSEPAEAVCIDAALLSHLPPSGLSFRTHRLARVWCDARGSCATGGHMVVWRGRVMMMRSYCGEVGCERAVRRVNSPRYRRGARVSSRSPGLVFMTLAARFESTLEELVIKAAVSVGL